MKRRDMLKVLGLGAGTAITAKPLAASQAATTDDPVGVLVDTTRCVGCRACEYACAEANGLPAPDDAAEPTPARDMTPAQWTVVRGFEVDGQSVTVKRQCMHCLQPACTSGCLTRALYKTPDGPVTWDPGKCMGCRYCMVSCPFDVPRFEYDSANPRIQKCQLCTSRVTQGQTPACVGACPVQALTFGRRNNLLDEARTRIYSSEAGKYVRHIYGEHEAGGTSWLYISGVPFERLGFRMDLAHEGYPTFAREFLYAVPQVDILAPLFMLALARTAAANKKKNEGDQP